MLLVCLDLRNYRFLYNIYRVYILKSDVYFRCKFMLYTIIHVFTGIYFLSDETLYIYMNNHIFDFYAESSILKALNIN